MNTKKLSAISLAAIIAMSSSLSFASNKSTIGVAKAKQIALKDSGIKSTNAAFVKAKLDTDDGKNVYDIEFYSNGVEYDYEIDAKTGAILEKDKDIDDFTIPAKSNTKNSSTAKSTNIGVAKAKEISLKDSKLKSSDVVFTKAKLDTDDGVQIYDVEFKYNGSEYEYEINAKTRAILEKNIDSDND